MRLLLCILLVAVSGSLGCTRAPRKTDEDRLTTRDRSKDVSLRDKKDSGEQDGKPAPKITAAGKEEEKSVPLRGQVKLKVPAEMLQLKSGDRKSITIHIQRTGELDQPITLLVKAPLGVTADPAEKKLSAQENKVEIQLQVAEKAVSGLASLEVIARTGDGQSVEEVVPLRIAASAAKSGSTKKDSGKSADGKKTKK